MVLTTLRESQHRAGESLVRVPTVSLYVLPRGRHFRGSHRIMAGAGSSPGASEWLPSQRPPGDARGGRRALGAACRGIDCFVRFAIGVRASPPGRGVGSSVPCSLGVLLEKNPLEDFLNCESHEFAI